MSAAFTISEIPLPELHAAAGCDEAGAQTDFVGIVRNHNQGRAVTALEYSAYGELATREGSRILDEAMRRFPLHAALASHRVGHLRVGEVAVRVSVAASHRDEAFTACRWIIDQIKLRVPIWKREHYRDGQSAWASGCEHI
jgi:molybdopterin synthase catalytic subunit